MIDAEYLSDKELTKELKHVLCPGKVGLEKESLRVQNSQIAKSKHPTSLGSPLCNQYITTDFAEAQIEMITPPFNKKNNTLNFLCNTHHFVSNNIGKEILWPFSMPPEIQSEQDILIADYGNSNFGMFKRIYRNGLSHRYGRSMQAISGLHFNYSFDDSFWELPILKKQSSDLKEFRSRTYFHVLRNLYRMNWLILYLFGASPILTKNFISSDENFLKLKDGTYLLPYATSLRMSNYGYQNLRRKKFNVSLNSINEYISDLRDASSNINEEFLNIEKLSDKFLPQLNSNILQTEDEYYGFARAKSKNTAFKQSTSKLKENGVDFIELRSLDLNPFNKSGVDEEALYFLEMLFIYCLFKESQPIKKDDMDFVADNDLLVAKFGRDPKLCLNKNGAKVSLRDWGNEILDEMLPYAEMLDKKQTKYSSIISSARSKINNPELTISGRLTEKILSEKTTFTELGNIIGESNKSFYLELDKSMNKIWELLLSEAKGSVQAQKELEADLCQPLKVFIDNYLNN